MEPELSFIRNEDRGKPLDRKTLIPLYNEFVLRLCDIQNSFATRLESSFAMLENRLEKAETLLNLVEQRLQRVSLADEDKPTTVANTEVPISDTIKEAAEISQEAQKTETTSEEQPTVEENVNMMKIKDHPLYNKYFKMIRLGIQEAAVCIKMQSEGVDPALLSNPDKLIEAVKIEESNSSAESDSD
ncbi:hypothetical protein M3Y97_00548900 [Aphelenchoides bicaudatus]|nr:hypothetical protein M3Y97_00548900 [Aphelenchoides bicaudatus]